LLPLHRSLGSSPGPRQHPFRLSISPIRRVMLSPCLSAAGFRFSVLPVPAEGLGLTCGWLTTTVVADLIGVPTFRMREIRSGWVSPMRRGLWCSRFEDSPIPQTRNAAQYHHINQGLMTGSNGTYTEIHFRSPVRASPSPGCLLGSGFPWTFRAASHGAVSSPACAR
jgi:hypothetical protein